MIAWQLSYKQNVLLPIYDNDYFTERSKHRTRAMKTMFTHDSFTQMQLIGPHIGTQLRLLVIQCSFYVIRCDIARFFASHPMCLIAENIYICASLTQSNHITIQKVIKWRSDLVSGQDKLHVRALESHVSNNNCLFVSAWFGRLITHDERNIHLRCNFVVLVKPGKDNLFSQQFLFYKLMSIFQHISMCISLHLHSIKRVEK